MVKHILGRRLEQHQTTDLMAKNGDNSDRHASMKRTRSDAGGVCGAGPPRPAAAGTSIAPPKACSLYICLHTLQVKLTSFHPELVMQNHGVQEVWNASRGQTGHGSRGKTRG